MGLFFQQKREISISIDTGSNQANRAISAGQLNVLPRFHLRPVEVVVCLCPQGRPCFEAAFPLNCFQRSSLWHIAATRCG